MELFVRPDDLDAAAAALRALAADLGASVHRFEATAARNLPALGPRAAPAAEQALTAAGAAATTLRHDYLVAADGLHGIAAAYAVTDARALRRRR
ncbi:MAG: hypothetical protein ACJ74O_19345 [Frankiaceae bacterium]